MAPHTRHLCRPYRDGARTYGGPWNGPGLPVVYFADHPALAVLEVRVHLDLPPALLPDDVVLMRVGVPENSVEEPQNTPERCRLRSPEVDSPEA